MKITTQAQVLRAYIGEQDMWHGTPLYAAIVNRLKEIGIAGVTVVHGVEGYGAHRTVHTARIEVLFQGLPILVEAVDAPERIALALTAMDEMVTEGLVTVGEVQAYRYTRDPPRQRGQ
ncbi:MAG: DUF190 domain-containing protein [Capsulimonadaceae bacterium]